MHKVAEAEAVLHEGLRNYPGSYDILFELGRLYDESYHDTDRARNVWEAGVRQWLKLDPGPRQTRTTGSIFEQIATHLGQAGGKRRQLAGRHGTGFRARKKFRRTPEALQASRLTRLKRAGAKSSNTPACRRSCIDRLQLTRLVFPAPL